MTIELSVLLILVWMHFVADFVFQTDKIAINKSSDNAILAFHVTAYSLPFLYFGWKFAAATWLAHFVTDWFTSRITKRLYQAGHRHWFFVTIGCDQALHFTAWFAASVYLVK